MRISIRGCAKPKKSRGTCSATNFVDSRKSAHWDQNFDLNDVNVSIHFSFWRVSLLMSLDHVFAFTPLHCELDFPPEWRLPWHAHLWWSFSALCEDLCDIKISRRMLSKSSCLILVVCFPNTAIERRVQASVKGRTCSPTFAHRLPDAEMCRFLW